LYFSVHTLFRRTSDVDLGPLHVVVPQWSTARPVSIAIAVVAAVLIFRFKWSVLRTLGACALLGLIASFTPISIT
jgi:chromate transporter